MNHPRVRFQAAVDGLREQLLHISSRAEEMIDLAVRSYFRCEPSLTSDVLALSEEMNRATLQIDEIVVQLLSSKTLTTPYTRQLMGFTKVNFNLESICWLMLNTADLGLSFCGTKRVLPANIPKVGLATGRLIRRALEAFIHADGNLATRVRDEADVVSLMGNEAWLEMVERIKTSPEILQQALCALMVVRNFEGIVSHAKSIAESVLLWQDRVEVEDCLSGKDRVASRNLRQKFVI